eukprot:jgi/Ulvmu1/1977/UM012_0139.1
MTLGNILPLVGVAALLSGVDARKSFDDIKKDLKDNGSGSSTSGYTGTSGTKQYSASVKCSSEAYASSYANYVDSYIEAVANVIADSCAAGWNGDVQRMKTRMSGFAGAWADATAEASAKCVSKVRGGGKAQGCAAAEATAYAFEVAFAEAHASASAEAFANYCSCDNAEAWAFGDADLFLVLVADAYAEATAVACAEGAARPIPPARFRLLPCCMLGAAQSFSHHPACNAHTHWVAVGACHDCGQVEFASDHRVSRPSNLLRLWFRNSGQSLAHPIDSSSVVTKFSCMQRHVSLGHIPFPASCSLFTRQMLGADGACGCRQRKVRGVRIHQLLVGHHG